MIKTCLLKNIKITEGINTLLKSFKFKPYHYLAPVIEKEKLSLILNKDIDRFNEEEGHYIVAAIEDEEVKGLALFYISKWDSNLFGFNYAILKHIITCEDEDNAPALKDALIKATLTLSREKEIRFLHTRVSCLDKSSIEPLEKNGFKSIAPIAKHILSLKNTTPFKISPYIREVRDKDIEKITAIAALFTDNRFFLDKKFDRDLVKKVYKEWIVNSCKGTKQDKVFVYDRDDRIAGFATCGLRRDDSVVLQKKIGSIDLVGIHSEYQNKGIAVKLVNNVIGWLRANADIAEAVTASGNTSMIKILHKFGFRTVSTELDMHWWSNG